MLIDSMNETLTDMDAIRVQGLEFEPILSAEQIREAVNTIGRRISQDFAGKNPICISILNGAFMFTADLVRAISFDMEVVFVKVASYKDMRSTGTMDKIIGLNDDLRGRDVIVVEDIVDTGHTISYLHQWLHANGAARVSFTALLFKQEAYKYDIPIDYYGFAIPNRFVVGYGLDYNGYGRSLPGVYVLRSGS